MSYRDQRDAPPGPITFIDHGGDWPAHAHGFTPGRWQPVFDEFDKLVVNGKHLRIACAHVADANRCTSAVHGYVKRRGYEAKGFKAATTVSANGDGTAFCFIRKIPVQKQ